MSSVKAQEEKGQLIGGELLPRKSLDSWVFFLLHLCAPVLPKGFIIASGALFVGAGKEPRLSSDEE